MSWATKVATALGLRLSIDPLSNFTGDDANDRIMNTLLQNPAINDDRKIAEQILSIGKPVGFQTGENIITQDAQDNDVYFLLSGEADIIVNKRKLTLRSSPNQVGEMAAIEPGKFRSATVRVRTEFVAAWKISGEHFLDIWKNNERFKERLQLEMSSRHRERIVAVRVANENNSFTWLLISVAIGSVTAAFTWYATHSLEWSLSAKSLIAGGIGLLTFAFTFVHNPTFIWRRCFVLALWCIIGKAFIEYTFVFEAKQGISDLQIYFAPSSASIDWENSFLFSLPFLIVMGICALKDR